VSWKVIVADPAILVVLFVGLVGSLALTAGSFLLLFRRLPDGGDVRFPGYLAVVPLIWIGNVASTYCNVVVTVMADRRLRGEEPTVTEGMSVATSRLGRILGWTALSLAVGLFLQLLAERLRLAGVIARHLLGLAWALATTFVVPVIALEDAGVPDSVRRSARIFRSKWGESVVAQGTIGFAIFVLVLPIMVGVGMVWAISPPAGVALLVVSLTAWMLLAGALDAVVRVALYRYAVDGAVLGAFTVDDLEASFTPKTKKHLWDVRAAPLPYSDDRGHSSGGAVDLGIDAPGWFSDPSGRHELRWWNGERWTSRVRTGDTVSGDPLGEDWT
jgi:hypothetical protein